MTNQAKMQGFDLDRLALELGALPEAPLAMPVQELESPAGGFFGAFFRLRPAPARKAGH